MRSLLFIFVSTTDLLEINIFIPSNTYLSFLMKFFVIFTTSFYLGKRFFIVFVPSSSLLNASQSFYYTVPLYIFFHSLSPFTVLVGLFLFFPLCAAGLRGTFPGHPRPPSLLLFPFWASQHEIQHKHPWEAHPAWDLNPADLAVVSSFHHPTVRP
jgi:hypothetical protein